MQPIAPTLLSAVLGGQLTERAVTDRIQKEFPRGSPQFKKLTDCLDANPPKKDNDDIKWTDVLKVLAKCAPQVLAK